MIKSEWKNIFKTPLLLASIFAVVIIPILYTGMFLWAFWDPYGSLSKLPVAIVNEDKGVVYEEKELDLGKELADKLVEGEEFQFKVYSKDEAEKALENQEIYMEIEIPENFSEHATTVLDADPSKLVMNYKVNEGYNFLGSQIGDSAIKQIREEVNEQVSETYAEQLLTAITTLGDGFTEASDGASELNDGAGEVATGANDLKNYLQQLAESTVELSDGTKTLADGTETAAKGANELQDGLEQLVNGGEQLQQGAESASIGASSLQTGIEEYTTGLNQVEQGYATLQEKQQQFTNGVSQIATSTQSIATGAENVATGTSELKGGIDALAQQLTAIYPTLTEEQAATLQATLVQLQQGSASLVEGSTSLQEGTNQLASGTGNLSNSAQQLTTGYTEAYTGLTQVTANSNKIIDGAAQIAEGNATLSEKLEELTVGITSAKTGSAELATGLNKLQSGSQQLNDGTQTLTTKSSELSDGGTTLADGVTQLAEGTATLSTELGNASEEVGSINSSKENYEMISNPVEVDKTEVNDVPNYGTGFAPYFISLGLAVGALILSTVYPFVQPVIFPTSATSWFASKTTVFAIVGFLQALIVSFIVVYVVGVEVNNMPLFILTTVIASYTFIAMIQLLVTVFNDVGRFIGLLLLILQLTTSAGTFPLELIPEPLQGFYGLLPMTYTVQAFRTVISTGDLSMLYHDYLILMAFMIISLILTYLYFNVLFNRRHSKVEGSETTA